MKLTSPKGIAQYPWLNRPDTKFDELGAYKVNLIVSKEDAQPFIKQILDGFVGEFGSKVKPNSLPWVEETDDQGNATGNVVLRYKNQNKRKRDGEFWDRKPIILNSDLEKTDDVIGAGSSIRVATEVYYWDYNGKKGFTLQIVKVQILDLKEPQTMETDDFGLKPEPGYKGKTESLDDEEIFPVSSEGEDSLF